MLQYYEQRQSEYEAIYSKPERQADLAELEGNLLSLVSGLDVLELACGTGYWTRRMAGSAASVHATDASAKLAQVALESCKIGNVTADELDALALPKLSQYNCVVAGFLWSHIAHKDIGSFLASLSRAFAPGTRIVLFDNLYVEGSSTPISRCTAAGDTFQLRTLSDGTTYEVLKNFPTTVELQEILRPHIGDAVVQESQYFWLAYGALSRG